MELRIHQSLTRVLQFPLAIPVGRKVGAYPRRKSDGVDPSLPSKPHEIEALYFKAVILLRNLVEKDGVDLDAALRTVIAENLLGLGQISQLDTQARARYGADQPIEREAVA